MDLYLAKPSLSIVITLENLVQVRFADGRVAEDEHLPDTGIRLLGLIGESITSVERRSEHCLLLHFERVSMTMGEMSDSGECYQIRGDGRQFIV